MTSHTKIDSHVYFDAIAPDVVAAVGGVVVVRCCYFCCLGPLLNWSDLTWAHTCRVSISWRQLLTRKLVSTLWVDAVTAPTLPAVQDWYRKTVHAQPTNKAISEYSSTMFYETLALQASLLKHHTRIVDIGKLIKQKHPESSLASIVCHGSTSTSNCSKPNIKMIFL